MYATSRWRVIGGEHPQAMWESNKPFIIASWHGPILMMPKIWGAGHEASMLISNHRDGRLIADVVQNFGIRKVTGSSSNAAGSRPA